MMPEPTPFPNDFLLPSMHGLLSYVQRLVLDGFRFEDDVVSGELQVYGPAVELYGPEQGLHHPLLKVLPAGDANKTAFYLCWFWQERKHPEKYLAERNSRPDWKWKSKRLSYFEY